MHIVIRWKPTHGDHENWRSRRCLYAYLHPVSRKILYIGKAGRRTVGQRFRDQDKRKLNAYLLESGIDRVEIIFGEILQSDGGRYSEALLADIESLLIKRLRPPGNILNTTTRPYSRPGMKVLCKGYWPRGRTRFHDRG